MTEKEQVREKYQTHRSRKHRRHRHLDEAEIFKNKNLRAKKRRQLVSRVLFVSLCMVAALIMIAVVWMYTAE